MELNNTKDIFAELLRAASRGYGERSVENPAVDFIRDVKAGDYDYISDEEYKEVLDSVERMCAPWQTMQTKTVKELLINALEDVDLSDDDVEDISASLMSAYIKTNHDRIPKASSDCNGKTVDLEHLRMLTSNPSAWTVRNASWNDAPYNYEKSENPTDTADILKTPAAIYRYLDERVYGQKDAKRAAAMLLWNHVNGRRQNVVFAGPTGCGKTEIFRQLAQIYPNIKIHNAPSITGTSWKGNMKVRNLFDGVSGEEQKHLIIVLDEADKLFEGGSGCGQVVQNELLKVLEGDMVHFEGDKTVQGEQSLDLDTSNISFVFLGSFEMMVHAKSQKPRALGFGAVTSGESFDGYNSVFTQEDLVEYANVRTEIAGRINNIVQLHEMTEEDYLKILSDKKISPLKRLSKDYHVDIKMPVSARKKLAKEAFETGMGVRYLKAKIQRSLDDMLFEDCGKKTYTIMD